MFRNFKQYIFPSILAISALSISGSAAYYSIFGLSKLFSGAAFAIIVMATALEVSKLIVASSLHKYWKTMNSWLKYYLIVALVSLMVITSMGIYGFLTSAYQETSNKSQVVEKEIVLIENQKQQYFREISRDSANIALKNSRVVQLADLRKQQESRIDSLYNKGWYNSARETEGIIKEANEDIKILELDMDTLNKHMTSMNDSITVLDKKIFETQINNTAAAELGPLKYVAELTGEPMDRIINWFMLLIIFVFDPLAIALVLNANFAFSNIKHKPKKEWVKPSTNMQGYRNPPPPPSKVHVKPDIGQTRQAPPPPPQQIKVKQVPTVVKENPSVNNLIRQIQQLHSSGLSERKRNAKIEVLKAEIKRIQKEGDNTITY